MLQTILLVVHILVSIALIAIILLQQGRGATAGAAFGSGASGTVFGARGSTSFLSRTTSILATLFFGNCLLLAFLATEQSTPTSIGRQLEQQVVAPPVPAGDAAPLPSAPAAAVDAPGPAPAGTSAAAPAPAQLTAPPAGDLPQIPSAPGTQP